MGFIKSIVGFLADICYLLIIAYVLVCAPMVFRFKPMVVLSGSMEPTFKVGSVIYTRDCRKEDIAVGDIVTFKLNDDTYVSHRVHSIDENGLYETKGDANDSPDPKKLSYDDIVGKDMNIMIPYIGYYIQYVRNHMYLTIVVIVILVLEFLLSNLRIFNINNKRKEN
jgi:signal peptidase